MTIFWAFFDWFIVVLVFSLVVEAVKLLVNKKEHKSFVIKAGLVFWIVVGSVIFFLLFGHAKSGLWLWQN